MKRRGAVFVAFLFVGLAFLLFLEGALTLMGLMTKLEREQTITDTTVLSSLRLRAKALQTIAGRWDDVGRHIVAADSSGVLVPRANADALNKAAQNLSGSISGYQGRVTATVTVLADAYKIARSEVSIENNAAAKLGIVAQSFLMRDEDGNTQVVLAGWYKRTWTPTEYVVHRYGTAFSVAQLLWEADAGNGGYPVDWSAARLGNTLDPYRYPFFRAELVEP